MYEKGIRVGKPHPLFARHDWGSMFGEGPMPTLTSLMNEEGIDGSTKLTTLMGIGEKDDKKEMYHLEKAAICGHIEARYNLAICEKMHDRIYRAVKHWIIAANLGCDRSIHDLKVCYGNGAVSKEDFAAALRAHQAAVDATKSPQRDAAEAFKKFCASQQQTFGRNAWILGIIYIIYIILRRELKNQTKIFQIIQMYQPQNPWRRHIAC